MHMTKPMSITFARKRIEELKEKLDASQLALKKSRDKNLALLKKLKSERAKTFRMQEKIIRSEYASQV